MAMNKNLSFKLSIFQHGQRRKIPPVFSASLRKPLPKKVFFRNCNLHRWVVNVGKIGSKWYFLDGWEKFVEDHRFVQSERNTFFFKFDGKDLFDFKLHDPSKPKQKKIGQTSGSGVSNTMEAPAYPSKRINPYGYDLVTQGLDLQTESLNFFVTKVKRRKDLFVPMAVAEDLTLPNEPYLIDEIGRRWKTRLRKWKDGRYLYCGGWEHLCAKNFVTEDDRCLCEFVPAGRGDDKGLDIRVRIIRVDELKGLEQS